MIKKAKKLTLGKDEKNNILACLVAEIKEKPFPKAAISTRWKLFGSFSLPKLSFQYTVSGLVIAIMAAGGVSFAAESSLPGDTLFPFKIKINEEIMATLSFTPESKAKWETRRAERRLEEAEILADRGILNSETIAKVEDNFEIHAKRVKERLEDFTKEDLKAASDIGSNFETSLRVHGEILEKLSDKNKEGKLEIKAIAEKVKENIEELKKSKVNVEEKISKKPNGELKTAAEMKLKTAVNKIDELRRFIGEIKNSLDKNVLEEVEDRLKSAEETVREGKEKLEVKEYGTAFLLFQEALQTSNEAKLLIKALQNLKIDIEIKKKDKKEFENE